MLVPRSFWEPLFTENFTEKNQSKFCSGFSYRIFKTTYMLTFKNQFNHAYVRNRSPHDFVIRCHLLANVQASLQTSLCE